LSLVSYC